MSDWTVLYKENRGNWLALLSDEKTIAGRGKTLAEARKDAGKKGHKEIFVFRVPEEDFNFIG